MPDDFKVKVGEFEGPLDLLLSLIEKRKLHISQVSLAQVADDYINYLKEAGDGSMDEMANFIVVASTLMLIKSLALLPGLQLTEEEKSNVEDLENRLKRYQQIRDLSLHIKERFGQQIIFNQGEKQEELIVFAPTRDLSLERLVLAVKNLVTNLPIKEKLPQAIIKKVISLEEVISNLAKRVEQAIKLSFSDFVGGLSTDKAGKKDKINVIVSFLGMLELVKQGVIEIEQKAHFAEIEMENKNIGIPRY